MWRLWVLAGWLALYFWKPAAVIWYIFALGVAEGSRHAEEFILVK